MDTPNYKESTVSGTQWQRACRVVVENPLNLPDYEQYGIPSVLFVEEKVILAGSRVIKNPCANISVAFDLNNPLHLQFYEVANAIYVEERDKRDAAAVTI